MQLTAHGKRLPGWVILCPNLKLLRIMRLTSFFLFVGLLQVHARSFEQTVSLKQKNADLSELFSMITRQTGYTFFYNDKTLRKAKKVDIDVKNANLEKVMQICFAGQPLVYSIIDKTIVIKAREEDHPDGLFTPPPPVEIRGKVVDSTDNPLAGVSVTVKGTQKAVVSNEKGEFIIRVAELNVTLVFSSVGFASQEVRVNNRSFMTIHLLAVSKQLEDVVITALGIKREKRSLGYATSTVTSEELTKSGATMNPFLALYGKASGVGVNVGTSGPEGGVKINIRGAASMNPDQNVRPLFVVDGVILTDRVTSIGNNIGAGFDYGAGINDINSEDIESVEILKGAKATVLYGSDAANGVVLITTKSGRNTRGFGMTGSFQYTLEKPVSMIKFQNEYGLGESIYDTSYATINGKKVRLMPNDRYNFGPKFDGADVMFYDSSMVKNVAHPDNYQDLFRNGYSTNANVAISGSSEKGSLRASYTHYDYKDIISPNAYQNRNTFSFNGSIRASSLASFEVVSNIYSINTQNRRGSNAGSIAWGFPRDFGYDQLYNLYLDSTGYQRDLSNYGAPTSIGQLGSYMWGLDKDRFKDSKLHMITSAKVTLNFTKHIFLVGQAGLDYDNTDYTTETSVDRILPVVAGGGFSFSRENNSVQTYQALLNYDKTFANDLHLYAFAGGVYRYRSSETIGSSTVGGLNYAGWYSFSNEAGIASADNEGQIRNFSRGSDVLYSALASATLSWKNEIYAEFQGRQDWNSTLPPQRNKYFYPGVSLTWNYTDRFKIPYMNRGQLRLAWADVGNGTSRYFANNQYGFSRLTGTSTVTVTPPSSLLPGALGPEKKREFEVGINNTFFKENRIVLDFSVYVNNRYNQIVGLPISAASSSDALKINVGNVKNWGYELAVTGTPVIGKDLRWDLTFNAASQGSRVIKLYPGISVYPFSNLINGSAASIHADEGKPYGEIVMNDYARDDAGNKIVSSTGVYSIDPQKTIDAGNVMPKVYGGFLSDFHYKSFDFRIGLDYKYGGTIFSYTNNRLIGTGQLESTLQYRDEQHGGLAYYINSGGQKVAWKHDAAAPPASSDGHVYHDGLVLPGDKMDATGKYVKNDIIASAMSYYGTYMNDLATSFPPDHLYKNNYIKLREVALAYTLPRVISNKLRLQKLTVTLAARNLFYIYKSIPNIDPEGAVGADAYLENTIYPSQRTYSAGFNVAF
jgi:iron complex outermembrane receptor protein